MRAVCLYTYGTETQDETRCTKARLRNLRGISRGSQRVRFFLFFGEEEVTCFTAFRKEKLQRKIRIAANE
jgi:hypothetical protein